MISDLPTLFNWMTYLLDYWPEVSVAVAAVVAVSVATYFAGQVIRAFRGGG